MGPDLTELPRATACPSCGASLRPDAPWCTLCYADLRPKPEPEPAQPAVPPTTAPATAAYGPPAADPLTQPLLDFLPKHARPDVQLPPAEPGTTQPPGELSWPCTECASPNPLSSSSCGVCGAGFLAKVAEAGRPSLVLPVIGDLGRLSRGQRMAAAFGAVAVLLLPLALLTLLLTGSPPKNQVTTVVVHPSGGPTSSSVGAP